MDWAESADGDLSGGVSIGLVLTRNGGCRFSTTTQVRFPLRPGLGRHSGPE